MDLKGRLEVCNTEFLFQHAAALRGIIAITIVNKASLWLSSFIKDETIMEGSFSI